MTTQNNCLCLSALNFISTIRETLITRLRIWLFSKQKKQTLESDFFKKKMELQQTFDSSNNYTRVPFKRAFLLRGHKKMVPLSGGPTYPGSQLSGVF